MVLLGTLTVSAKQYCHEPLTSGSNTVYLTAQKITDSQYQLKIEADVDLAGLGGSFCSTSGGNLQLNGPGNYEVSADKRTITVDIPSTTPPQLYTPLYVLMPGEVNFGEYKDIEWGVCNVVEDNEKPVMTSAELVSKSGNAAVIAVAATDNIGVTSYRVVDAAKSIDAAFAPKEGKITVTGLTPTTEYNFTITAKDAAGNESDNNVLVKVTTDVEGPQVAAPAPTRPAEQVFSFYSDAYNPGNAVELSWQDWGSGSGFEEKKIGEDNLMKINANNYFGIHLLADVENSSLNVMHMEYMHFDVWAETDMTFNFGPVWIGGEKVNPVTVKGQQWNQFDVAFTDYTGFDASTIRQLKADGFGGKKEVYFDNIYLYTTKEIVDDEIPTDVKVEVAETSFFSVTLSLSAKDNSGLVNFDVMLGEEKVATAGGASEAVVKAVVGGLLPNTDYSFSVVAYDVKNNKAEAVAVTAKTAQAPAPAPVPAIEAENVMAIFSDAYTPVVPADFNKNDTWWNRPQMAEGMLAEGDNILYYFGFTDGMVGWTFGTQFDATGFNYLYVDIYPLQAGTIEIYPVVEGTEENPYHKTSAALKADQWNTVVIDYTGLDLSKIKQMGWINYYSFGSFFVDNVYFSNVAPENTAVENLTLKTTDVRKVVENGVLYIIRDNIRYNVLGAQVR